MRTESIEELCSAFSAWREQKRHEREPIPEELLDRARQAAGVHGFWRVARLLGIKPRRLKNETALAMGQRHAAPAPAYSRLALTGLGSGGRPFAEVESPTGFKVRLYSSAPEALSLLAAVCAGERVQ
jgi:hypothetical protein